MQADLLRCTTAGSVDDGKSTLIGRLLYDTKTAFQDQLDAVADASRRRGDERVNLALLTDGLRAEREQGITIDVAYRYFATPSRKFIIADTPGHLQYTRNMVTGASTAGLAIILIDARHGLVEQSRRHALIASLLRIPHVAVAVNKMDLVNWSESRFREIEAEVRAFVAPLGVELTALPMSALTGANVVERSAELAWFTGPTLLEHLEAVPVARDREVDLRFPVQWVIRPQSSAPELHDYRGFAGALAAGTVRPGDSVIILPSGRTTSIARIERGGRSLDEASAPASVTLHIADNIDVSRGDVIASIARPPTVNHNLEAMVCWMAERPLAIGARYLVKHTTRTTKATITSIVHQLDITTGQHRDSTSLGLNDLGRIRLQTQQPLIYDPYEHNRTTGSFVLIDEGTNATVAAGMLV